MHEIFTLMNPDSVLPIQKMISMLESSLLNDVFESEEFINLLDENLVKPPQHLVEFLLKYGLAFEALSIQNLEDKEVALN